MSIPRLLGIVALLLFIVFVATFFTVLVRLSRIGVVTERLAPIAAGDVDEEEIVHTTFDLIGHDPDTGQLRFRASARFNARAYPFSLVSEGQELVLRIENLVPDLRRNIDLVAEFSNPTGDNFVNVDFGEFRMDTLDRRDFYPFDGYDLTLNFAYHIPGDWSNPAGSWYEPKRIMLRSLTNLIFLNPRYGTSVYRVNAFKARVARLRILQFLTATLILIEVLFALYLLTVVNMQELLGKGLGYLVGLYIIRNILVTNAPQFPTLIDYSSLFLICVVFFLMLFKFLGGAEEHALITIPSAWRDALLGTERPDENDDSQPGE